VTSDQKQALKKAIEEGRTLRVEHQPEGGSIITSDDGAIGMRVDSDDLAEVLDLIGQIGGARIEDRKN
jgi:hypothetical protein